MLAQEGSRQITAPFSAGYVHIDYVIFNCTVKEKCQDNRDTIGGVAINALFRFRKDNSPNPWAAFSVSVFVY